MKDQIFIKQGSNIIVYGFDGINASQIANCYGLSGYPKLRLVNNINKDLRGVDTSNSVELHIRTYYPKIIFIK